MFTCPAPASRVLLTLCSLAVPLALRAQTRDPVTEAKALFDARTPATTTAGTLKRDHARTITQTSTILRTVGYPASDVVPALRTEFTSSASTLYQALRVAGYDARSSGDAMTRDGFVLSCIDPQGYAVPCGGFGGPPDTPVMGQLTVHPSPEGETGQQLYITGSNIPPVFVMLGGAMLTELNASSSAVVVRLPSTAMTGNLTIRRKSDNVSGTLQQNYRVVAPPLNWSNWAQPAIIGAVEDMKRWLQGARVQSGCAIDGPLTTLAAGSFTSATGYANTVRTRLTSAGAPAAIADAWDLAFRQAFDAYTSQIITVPPLALYPSFAAVMASKIGPVPNVPMPLGAFTSLGGPQMLAPALGVRVKNALAPVSVDVPARAQAADAFATAVSGHFAGLLLNSLVVNLMGEGPVPTYKTGGAGPVSGGTCKGTNIVLLK
ncbi:MAG: hypothetical protein IPK85_01105 [Gemmatimonadetes bacterium]|nr:hypothetical protein [Gemmatimonadota bacterium]